MGIKQMLGGATDAPRCWLEGDDPEVARNNALWRRQAAQRRLERLDRDRAQAVAEIAEEDAALERIAAREAEGAPTVSSHIGRCGQLVQEAESVSGYGDRATVAHAAIIAADAIERVARTVKPLALPSVESELRRLRDRIERARSSVGLSAA